MINPKIFNAVLMAATKETKDLVLKALVEHVSNNCTYTDENISHIIDMLVDKNAFITPEKINLKWIEEHPKHLIYNIDKYIIRNISVASVDNIDCIVKINFEFTENINKNINNAEYIKSYTNINFNDYPKILK